MEVDVERHAVLKDTTVVKYLHSVATSSSAVIDRVTSSTLEAAAAKDLGDSSSSSSFITTDSGEDESTPHANDLENVVADTAEEAKVASLLNASDEKMDVDEEEEKPSAVVQIPPNPETEEPAEAMEVDPEDEVVSETPQSGDMAREADDERSDAPGFATITATCNQCSHYKYIAERSRTSARPQRQVKAAVNSVAKDEEEGEETDQVDEEEAACSSHY